MNGPAQTLSVAMRFRPNSNPLDAGSVGEVATLHLEVEVILHRYAFTRQDLSPGLARRSRSQSTEKSGDFSPRKEEQIQLFY